MLEAAAAYLSLLIILIVLPTLYKTPVNAVKLEVIFWETEIVLSPKLVIAFIKEEDNVTAVVVAVQN